jgi:transposase
MGWKEQLQRIEIPPEPESDVCPHCGQGMPEIDLEPEEAIEEAPITSFAEALARRKVAQ